MFKHWLKHKSQRCYDVNLDLCLSEKLFLYAIKASNIRKSLVFLNQQWTFKAGSAIWKVIVGGKHILHDMIGPLAIPYFANTAILYSTGITVA